jgi:hypothetical protein
MREQVRQTKKADGPFGIRTLVWLIVFGLALVCVLMVSVSSRYASQPTPTPDLESPSYQEASNHKARSLRPHRIEFAVETGQDRASNDLDEAQLATIEQMTQDSRTWWDNPE